MKVVLGKNTASERIVKMAELLNQVVKIQLPAITCDFKDIIYSAVLDNDTLHLSAYLLGDKVKIDPKFQTAGGAMLIAKCLPKFIGESTEEYRNMMGIISTNSNSFIWLQDDFINQQVKEEIWLESHTPMFDMVYELEPLPTINLTIDDTDILLRPQARITEVTRVHQTEGQYSLVQ